MNRIILEVYLPVVLHTFDVQVPAGTKLTQVVRLTTEALGRLTGAFFYADDQALLCDRESGEILDINMTVWDAGLRNGSRLMLI